MECIAPDGNDMVVGGTMADVFGDSEVARRFSITIVIVVVGKVGESHSDGGVGEGVVVERLSSTCKRREVVSQCRGAIG